MTEPVPQGVILAAIEAQTCPWCESGPWKVLAQHTNIAHGIDRHELRRLAGLDRTASICSPEFRERVLERKATGDLDPPSKRPLIPGTCPFCGRSAQVIGGKAGRTCGRNECVTRAKAENMTAVEPWKLRANIDKSGRTLEQRVLDFLADHPNATGQEIRAGARGRQDAVRVAIDALVADGRVVEGPPRSPRGQRRPTYSTAQ